MYNDKTIKCKDCGEDFIFTAGEQEFYAEKGFKNEPQRCKKCRAAKKNSSGRPRRDVVLYEVVCSKCGKIEKVPFEPRHDRPVYCNDCYKQMRK